MSEAQAVPVTENGAPVLEKPQETPGFKVFAGNLAYSTTDEGLKAFFAPVQSDILSVQVIQRGTRSAGYGFVALSTEEAAQKAVDELNKQELEGRPVIVEIAKPAEQKDKEKEKKSKRRPGRRGGKAVPGEVTEAEANGEAPKPEEPAATEQAAKPKKKKASKRSSKKKAATPVEGEAPKDAAATTEGEDAPKKAPRVRKPKAPRPARPAGEDPAGEPSKTMLFVANLGFNVDDEGLAELFKAAGIAVNSARIVRRRWGQPRKSKGYGFVDVGSQEEQNKAIDALDGKDVAGRPIAVKVAVNTPHEEDAATEEAAPAEAAPAAPAPAEAAAPGPAATTA